MKYYKYEPILKIMILFFNYGSCFSPYFFCNINKMIKLKFYTYVVICLFVFLIEFKYYIEQFKINAG